ncbi:hypothetical protein K440DRAFT_651426 [Wilcoxina mikolae CBS 423.85]|nr:hypothetical protein K440DRAFT_651426 [Wilcoxina mikolae CBS 423.85]
MFFHSPLLYWNCSLEAVENDRRVLRTVNDNIFQHSSAGITLRWSSVFAGKQFSHQKLIAADALVISLFYDLNSTAGELWDQRAAKIALEARQHGRFKVYPPDGKEDYSHLYEFRFQPLSVFDIFTLSACYMCAAAYLAVSLRRLRAVKSRFGLVITVLTQVGTSIMSSFTILAVLKIPVSHVPREVFPFVIIVIGLENMFRLINAVFATPAEQPTTQRISGALGEVGFISFVAVATDLAMLAVIARVSVPAVREFCLFAGVALLVDFILHMTFFLAVLSVDVRRLELQDSLDKLMSLNFNEDDDIDLFEPPENTNAASEFLFRGGSPLSTRIAGSAIMICFAIALNMHFLDNQHPIVTLMMLVGMLRNPNRFHRSLEHEMPLNVARTPLAWLSKQDECTGMELIRAAKHMGAVKLNAVRIVAKAYQPLFFELVGSDRAETPGKMPNIISTIDIDVLKDHMQFFLFTVVVVAAGITISMNYLLRRHDLPEDRAGSPGSGGPFLKCQTLVGGHSLDVVMLASSPRGILVSVGLDRRIVVWKLKSNHQPCLKDIIRPTCAEHILWPVLAIALDEKGEWLAIAPKSGKVSFYQLEKSSLYRSLEIDMQGHQPSAFFFAPRNFNDDQHHGPRLLVLRNDGWLFEVYVKTKETVRHQICEGVVLSSSHGVFTPRLPLRIVTACQRGRIFVTAKSQGEWKTQQLDLMSPPYISPIMEPGEPCAILPLSSLGMVISSRSCNVELVDILSGSIIRSFQTGQFKPGSLRAFHAEQRTCLYCGCPSVLSFSLAYSERESGMFMMHTFSSSRGKMRDICLRAERDRRERKCSGFESVVETTHWLDNVEGWEPTNLNMIAGIRRREMPMDDQSSDDYEPPTQNCSNLRRRKKVEKRPIHEEEDEWEAWTMDACGVVTSYPLIDDLDLESRGQGLLVSRAGPVSKVGQRSVAVGFGNNVKVLRVGTEWFEDEDNGDLLYHTMLRRPRPHRMR